MTFIQAIVMGIIQGLTEFLPVSSSGHLALFKILFHVETDTGMLFDVLLHAGTLLAICAVYHKDIRKMFLEGLCILRDVFVNVGIFFKNFAARIGKKEEDTAQVPKLSYRRIVNNSYRKLVLLIFVSTIPTAIIGIVAKDVVEMAANILLIPGICLIVTAILLLIADHCRGGEKLPKDVSYSNAFIIGIAQGAATLPGLSRSGTTIAVCLLSGFHRGFAVKYSFLMSIPAVLGAMILELKDFAALSVTGTQAAAYIVGMLTAAVVGYVCIKTMLFVVRKKNFRGFAVYCLIVGLISVGGFLYTL